MSRSSHDIIGSENLEGHRQHVQNLGESVGEGGRCERFRLNRDSKVVNFM